MEQGETGQEEHLYQRSLTKHCTKVQKHVTDLRVKQGPLGHSTLV